MSFPAYPSRVLTEEEVKRFEDDGVIMIKGAIDPDWMALVESGIEEARNNVSMVGKFTAQDRGLPDGYFPLEAH